MGTETISMWEYLFSHSMWMVKKYPPDGDENFFNSILVIVAIIFKCQIK